MLAGLFVAALLACALLLLPWWWRGYAQRGVARRRANVAAYRQRLAELRAEARAGTIDPSQLPALEEELGRRLLADAEAPAPPAPSARGPAVPLLATAALLAFAGLWYGLAGSWRVHDLVELSRRDPDAARTQSLARSVVELERRVEEAPADGEAWTWLAQVRFAQGEFAAAAEAYAKASALAGGADADLLSAQGEALAYAQDKRLSGEPSALFARALAVAPDHPQALWYAGLAALQAGDAATARAQWGRLVKLPIADDMRTVLEQTLAGLGPPAAGPAAADGLVLAVDIRLGPGLAVRGDETLFVYALEPGGPPMPVAARKLERPRLPVRLDLSDADSVMPARALSSLDRWTVRARLSRSGEARAQPGDLLGEIEVTRAQSAVPLTLTIDRRVGGEME